MQYFTNQGTIQETQWISCHGGTTINTKPQISYVVIAGSAIKDMFSKKWSFIDLFDNIAMLPNLDFLYQSFYIGCRINNVEPGESKTEIKIISPNGKTFASETLTGTLVEGAVAFAAAFNLLKFEVPGKYYVHIIHNGKKLADDNKYYFEVNKPQ